MVLALLAHRDPQWRYSCLLSLFDEVVTQLTQKAPPVPALHAAFLVLGELVTSAPQFTLQRYREVCHIITLYRDHKAPLVRHTVLWLTPTVARLNPAAFTRLALAPVAAAVSAELAIPAHRDAAFLIAGQLAAAVGRGILSVVQPILREIGLSLSAAAAAAAAAAAEAAR